MTEPKIWPSGKTKKLKLLQNLNYCTNQTYLSYLKTENPNFDKTQEIKSKRQIIFWQIVFELKQLDT